MMSDIVGKVMCEVITVLALATKQIKQVRQSKWTTTTYGASLAEPITEKFAKSCLERATLRLSCKDWTDLTQEEARMTAASTLEVVHGLFNNLKEVINGAPQVFFRDVNDRDACHRTALLWHRGMGSPKLRNC